MRKLKDWFPTEANSESHLEKLYDLDIIAEYSLGDDDTWVRWPGTHKHVMNWCVLSNGIAVGFNENPGVGWSFPTVNYKRKFPFAFNALVAGFNINDGGQFNA